MESMTNACLFDAQRQLQPRRANEVSEGTTRSEATLGRRLEAIVSQQPIAWLVKDGVGMWQVAWDGGNTHGAVPVYAKPAATAPIRRVWAMPSSDTFDVQPIAALVRKYLRGVSVDPFARNKQWATHTNDLSPSTAAEHHMDAVDFLTMLAERGVVADCVILDPPYSPRQMAECYAAAGRVVAKRDTQNARLYADVRRAARLLCKVGTVVLSFGWNSAGMGRGFETVELLLVAHGGAHNDTICLVERMVAPELDLMANAC